MLIRESISFQRGNDPKDALGIGQRHLIEKWLKEQRIENYIINDNMTIDVNEPVSININNGNIPEYIQFNKIKGNFICNDNKLTSLRGCPYHVTDAFFCSRNYLTSMEYAPKIVENNFWCTGNKGKRLSEEEVRKYCNVGNMIILTPR